MTHPIKFSKTDPASLLLAGVGAQLYDGTGNPPVVSSFALLLQAHPPCQPTFQPTAANSAVVRSCPCPYSCGITVPLVVNGSYNDPNGDGINYVTFKLSSSPSCGIPVANVLRGDLEGLVRRDELIVLNPRASSMRLRIEVSNPSSFRPSHRLTYVKSGLATRSLHPRSEKERSIVYIVPV